MTPATPQNCIPCAPSLRNTYVVLPLVSQSASSESFGADWMPRDYGASTVEKICHLSLARAGKVTTCQWALSLDLTLCRFSTWITFRY